MTITYFASYLEIPTYLQFMISLPKYFTVLHNLFWRFPFDFFRNGINFIPTILFMQTYKLVEITFAPTCETLNIEMDVLTRYWN